MYVEEKREVKMRTRITKIETLPKLEKKTKVAAYCRVSSGKDAMLHSLSNQVSYYNDLIRNTPGWGFVGVYADEAVSGTKDTRDAFQKLVNDCRKGKIDLIIVKAISRFARNTITMLATIRELKKLGVDVFFEEQNLHSLSSEGELVLTFLASFAQEEARNVSENMKWRVKRNFEQGVPWSEPRNLGYEFQGKKMIVIPKEANLVRRIFDMYVGGMGFQAIANRLNEENIKAMHGGKWKKEAVRYILNNVNYTGDLLLQKYFNADYLSKKSKWNTGQKDKYLVEDDHEAIVSKDTFRLARELMNKRARQFNIVGKKSTPHDLASLVKCSICGKTYRHKTTRYTEKWICSTYSSEGKAHCASKAVPDKELKRLADEVVAGDVSKIGRIVVHPDNTLVFFLTDGRAVTKKWHNISRKDSWTDKMKEEARRKTLEKIKEKR